MKEASDFKCLFMMRAANAGMYQDVHQYIAVMAACCFLSGLLNNLFYTNVGGTAGANIIASRPSMLG